MKIAIESTDKIVQLQLGVNGDGIVPARLWEGHTDSGIPVHCYVTRIVPTIEVPLPDEVARQFASELRECVPPSAVVQSIPLRMIL